MMFTTYFTEAQHKIIIDLCNEQIASLKRVLLNKDDFEAINHYVQNMGGNPMDVINECQSFINAMEKIKNNPNSILDCDPIYQKTLRAILSKIEGKYQNRYPNALSNLWKKFFISLEAEESGISFN